MRAGTLLTLLCTALLAGCTQAADPKPDVDDEDFDGLGLQADKDTGVIRGVVVDEAIRPVPGVTIALSGVGAGETKTEDNGLFGFSRLAPGSYFLSASKPGFLPVQQSVEVVAGDADPPITKILLTADAATTPFAQTYHFDGYIECSGSFVAAGLAACSAAGLPNDRFIVEYEIERPPQWIQSEMHWSSTQALSPELDLVYSQPGEGALMDNWAEAYGPSPLLIQVDETLAANRSIGAGENLLLRVFNQPVEGTEPAGCVPRPVLGGCTTGLGVTVSQKFDIYTNVFYGYAPPADWRFADNGPYPPPA